MTDGDQAILNMLMQINNSLVKMMMLLVKMKEDGVNVRTQESHAP